MNTLIAVPGDHLGVKGYVRALVTDLRTGRVEELGTSNLVVTGGKNLLRDLLRGLVGVAGLTHVAVGTDATAPVVGQTALVTEVFRDVVTAFTPASGQLTVTLFLGSTQANGSTLREVGLFTADNTMFARATPTSVVKDATKTVTYLWDITF